jgi:hypothetical protein
MQQHELVTQISKMFVGTPTDFQQLVTALRSKTVPELEIIAAQYQLKATARVKTKLALVRSGLADTERNWSLIDNQIGFEYSVEQFRQAIDQDSEFKNSLQWESQPFAEVVLHEQKQTAFEQRQFAMFVGAAKAATAQGRNTAPNQANYQLIKEALEDDGRDFNSGNVVDAIFRYELGLAPNEPEVANALVQERDDQERDRLAELIVDAMRSWKIYGSGGAIVTDHYGRDQELKKVKQLSLIELRAKAQVIEHNRFLAGRPLEDVQNDERLNRREQSGGKTPLPDTNQSGEKIDRNYLLRLSNVNLDAFKRLVIRHGFLNVTNRLQGKG